MTVQFLGLLIGFALGAFLVGFGVGRVAERGHHRVAAWLVLGVIVLGPAVVGYVLGGAS